MLGSNIDKLLSFQSKTYLLFFFVLNLFVKGIFIQSNELCLDEPFSVYFSQLPIPKIIQHLNTGNNPPLYEIFLHFWTSVFGISTISVRIPSLIFTSLAVIFIFKIAELSYNKSTAIVTSILFTFSNYYLLFSHEARGYSLFLLLLCISIYFFVKLLDNFSRLNALLFLITNILLSYLHYLSIVPLACEFIYIIYVYFKNKKIVDLKKILLLYLIHFIAYIPQIIAFTENMSKSIKEGTWLSPPKIDDLYIILQKFSNQPVPAVIFIATIIIAVFIKTTVAIKKSSSNFFYISFFIPNIIAFIFSQFAPMYLDKYLVFLSPFYYLIIAISLIKIAEYTKIKTLLFIVIIPFIISFSAYGMKSDNLKKSLTKATKKSVYIITPEWYKYTFLYHYNNGEYFSNKDAYTKNIIDNLYFTYSVVEQLKNENVRQADTINLILTEQNFQNLFSEIKKEIPINYKTNFVKIISKKIYYIQICKKN